MVSAIALQWLSEPAEDPRPRIFLSVSKALENPGTTVCLTLAGQAPKPLNIASAAFLTAWLNPEAPVWTDLSWESNPVTWLHAVSGCSWVTEPSMAALALITNPFDRPRLDQFRIGEPGTPEASTLLVIQVQEFSRAEKLPPAMEGLRCKAPIWLPADLPRTFWEEWGSLQQPAPLGVDVLFTCGSLLLGLPRRR